MDDRAKADMVAIKAREARVKSAIAGRELEVDIGSFTMAQLGLSLVVADERGGLWNLRGQKLVLVGAIE